MNIKYLPKINIEQLKRKIFFKLILSLFVLLQIVFPNQAFAFSLNDTVINCTTSPNSLFGPLWVKDKPVIPVTGVTLNKSSLTLKVKSSSTIVATLIPSDATDKTVYWSSSDTAIAKVSLKTGRVTGVRQGTALITASTEDGNMTAVCEVEVYNPDIVTFEDPNLEEAVRDNINKPTGDLLKDDVKTINDLDAENKSITDLSGIEKLINLKRLNLGSNQIADFSNLKRLNKLTFLGLSNNQLSDIDILKNFKNLTSLDLDGNQITDLSPLEGLTRLKSLSLSNNQISDTLPLKKLTKLTNLYLDQNQIDNINPLRVLTKLKYLDLSQNSISDSDKRALRDALPRCKITF